MNTKVSDARQKLFDLSKKYSAGNYKIKESYSEDSLTVSSESLLISPKSKRVISGSDKENKFPSHSNSNSDHEEQVIGSYVADSVQVSKYASGVNIVEKDPSNSQGCSDLFSKFPNVSDGVVEDSKVIIRQPSESDVSSIRSYSTKNDKSVVEEIFSDEDIQSSLENDPFANVHLVSDDILEEIDSSIDSHSSIKEDLHTGRLSAVQSVKSLQLSSPIEPPKLEYQYASDFESSDNEDESLKGDSISGKKHSDSHSVAVTKKNSKEQLNDSESFNDEHELLKAHLTSEKKHAESHSVEGIKSFSKDHKEHVKTSKSDEQSFKRASPKYNSNKNKTILNDALQEPVIKHNEVKLEKSNTPSSEIKTKSEVSNKTDASVSSLNSDDVYESVSELHTSNEENCKSHVSDYQKSGVIDELSEIKTSLRSSNENVSRQASITDKSSQRGKERLCSKVKSETQKTDVGVNTKLFNASCYKNKGIQTSKNLLNDTLIESNLKTALRRKWYINTNVRDTKYRPVVKSSKLLQDYNDLNSIECTGNPLMFTPQSGLPADKLLDEILRNQIAMTKYFIKCNHNLYLQCCKTVKSLNKEYKKSQTALFI